MSSLGALNMTQLAAEPPWTDGQLLDAEKMEEDVPILPIFECMVPPSVLPLVAHD